MGTTKRQWIECLALVGISVAVACSLGPLPSAKASAFPRSAVYFGNRSYGAPLAPSATDPVDTAYARALSRHEVITLDLAPWYSPRGVSRSDLPLMLHKMNPRCMVLGYHLITHWYQSPTFDPSPLDLNFGAEWQRAIRAVNGFKPMPAPGYEVDWSRAEVADTLGDLLVAAAASRMFDGLFLDYCAPVIAWTGSASARQDSASLVNMQLMVQRLRAAGGPGFVLIGNGSGADRIGLDGTMAEGYPVPLTSFDKVKAWAEGEPLGTFDWLQTGVYGTPYTASNIKLARLGLGTACLWGALGSRGPDRDKDTYPTYGRWYWDEDSVEPYPSAKADTTGRHAGWLGEPLGPPRLLAGGVWRRDFVHGLVLVKPTPGNVSVDLGEDNWQRIRGVRDPATNNGSQGRTHTVQGGDALFLLLRRSK